MFLNKIACLFSCYYNFPILRTMVPGNGRHSMKNNIYFFTFLFFKYFILFFNFTILYWFCHTSTWIRHRYTCGYFLNKWMIFSQNFPFKTSYYKVHSTNHVLTQYLPHGSFYFLVAKGINHRIHQRKDHCMEKGNHFVCW